MKMGGGAQIRVKLYRVPPEKDTWESAEGVPCTSVQQIPMANKDGVQTRAVTEKLKLPNSAWHGRSGGEGGWGRGTSVRRDGGERNRLGVPVVVMMEDGGEAQVPNGALLYLRADPAPCTTPPNTAGESEQGPVIWIAPVPIRSLASHASSFLEATPSEECSQKLWSIEELRGRSGSWKRGWWYQEAKWQIKMEMEIEFDSFSSRSTGGAVAGTAAQELAAVVLFMGVIGMAPNRFTEKADIGEKVAEENGGSKLRKETEPAGETVLV
ncbi:hypothetical protein C8J55DRAFT_489830 [Lentinula edodes]|uniref:Uncharacterized protein n=1 Tax=Lentinula lateritia TaxID=40482 RepID=A0A9W9DNG7_9AGAR|nr:hypothetical protein C8J55DRAFT_489830 [Lentinula edodes]